MAWQPSPLTLGAAQFGFSYGVANRAGKPSFERVCAILKAAAAGGVAVLDTAAAYGDSEKVLGEALRATGLADRFAIVTKAPPFPDGERDPDGFAERSVAGSLERLGFSRVAAVLVHRETDWEHWPRLARLAERGWIGEAGVSLDTARFLDRVADAPVAQIPVNAVDRRFEAFLDAAAARGTRLFARSAYLQGALAMDEAELPPYLAELAPAHRLLTEIARARGMGRRELCFRYALGRKGVSSVVFGVDDPEQLRENFAFAAAGPLPEAAMAEIRAAVPALPETVVRPFHWPK